MKAFITKKIVKLVTVSKLRLNLRQNVCSLFSKCLSVYTPESISITYMRQKHHNTITQWTVKLLRNVHILIEPFCDKSKVFRLTSNKFPHAFVQNV